MKIKLNKIYVFRQILSQDGRLTGSYLFMRVRPSSDEFRASHQ